MLVKNNFILSLVSIGCQIDIFTERARRFRYIYTLCCEREGTGNIERFSLTVNSQCMCSYWHEVRKGNSVSTLCLLSYDIVIKRNVKYVDAKTDKVNFLLQTSVSVCLHNGIRLYWWWNDLDSEAWRWQHHSMTMPHTLTYRHTPGSALIS